MWTTEVVKYYEKRATYALLHTKYEPELLFQLEKQEKFFDIHREIWYAYFLLLNF